MAVVGAAWEQQRDLVAMGAWKRGADAAADQAIDRWPAIEAFLRQEAEAAPFDLVVAAVSTLAGAA